jgi:hypothetical protein
LSGLEDFARLARLVRKHGREIASSESEEAVADWLYRNWYIDPDSFLAEDQA